MWQMCCAANMTHVMAYITHVVVNMTHGMANMKHGVADTMRCKHDQGVTSVTGVTDFSIDLSPKK